MTAEERLKGILEKETPCPICAGTGKDPIRHRQTNQEVPCRHCEGQTTIVRVYQKTDNDGVLKDYAIICEEIGSRGELLTQHKELNLIADKHRLALEQTGSGITNTKRLQNMRPDEDPVMQKCIDTWLAEDRGKA